MYAVLRHKTTHEVSILLHKERWGSTRQNIPLESFEATIYARLDTRKKIEPWSQSNHGKDFKAECSYH